MDKFLAALKKLLISDNADQQALYDNAYKAVEAQIAASGDATTTKDVFDALQKAIDSYKKETLDPIVTQNINDATKISAGLEKPQGRDARTQDFPVKGQEELTQKANVLANAFTNEKTQEILDAAVDADLKSESNTESLNTSYSARLVTNIHHDQQVTRVDGHGTAQTERRADKGKIRKGGAFKHEGNIPSKEYSKFVVRGDLFENDRLEYDTLDQIAEAWLNKYNTKAGFTLPALDYKLEGKGPIVHDDAVTLLPAGSGAANYRKNIQLVSRWMAHANELPQTKGHYCDKTTFDGFVIHVGDELATPKGEPIAPRQTSYVCTTCTVNNAPQSVDITLGNTIAVTEKTKTPPPPKENPTPDDLHYYARSSSESSYGKELKVGSTEWALQVAARTGVFKEFTEEYYALKQAAPRLQVKETKFSGMGGEQNGENTGEYLDEGRYAGLFNIGEENKKTKEDNGVKKRHGTTGQNFYDGPRGRLKFPQRVESIEANGDFKVPNVEIFMVAHGGQYAMTTFGYVSRLGGLGNMPVAANLGNPSKQEVYEAETRRWGLSQVDIVLAEVNKGAYHNAFADQKAVISSPLESPDRIIAHTFATYTRNVFAESMTKVETETDPVKKQEAAERALTAYRDFSDNFLVKGADAMREPLRQNGIAIREYLKEKGIDVAAIDAKLPTLERIHLVDMPKKQLEEQQHYKDSKQGPKERYATLKPGETNSAFLAAEKIAYPVMNGIEHTIAKGEFNVPEESGMIGISKEAWKNITQKPDGSLNEASIKSFGTFVAGNRNAAIEMGQTLRDVYDHYQNYGLSKDAAHKLVKDLCGGDEKVFRDVTIPGRTLPIPYTGDQALPVARPDLDGPVFGKIIQEKPELFMQLMHAVTSDEKGKSDGRRYGTALLRTLGAERPTSGKDGDEAPGLKALLETLPNDEDNNIRASVRTAVVSATAYAEQGASGRQLKGAVTLDNTMREAQRNKISDPNELYRNLFSTNEARDADADRVAVENLKNHPGLARDAVLGTILRNPNILKELEKELKVTKKSEKNKLNEAETLLKVIKETREAAEDYRKTGNQEDMKEAVEKFGRYFTKYADDADSKRERKVIRAAQRFDTWTQLLDIAGSSDAMSAALVETIGRDVKMRDAFLKAVPESAFADSMRNSNVVEKVVPDVDGDQLYASRFFTLPRDKSGKVDANKGLFGLGKRQVTVDFAAINSMIAGNTDETSITVENRSDVREAAISKLPADVQGQVRDILDKNMLAHLSKMDQHTQADLSITPAQLIAKTLAEHEQGLVYNDALVKSVQSMIDAKMLDVSILNKDNTIVADITLKAEYASRIDPLLAGMSSTDIAEVQKIAKNLGLMQGDLKGTNPKIYLGQGDMKDGVKMLANQLKTIIENDSFMKNDKSLNDPEKLNHMAELLIAGGYIEVKNQAGQLIAVTDQDGIGETLAIAAKANMARGIDRRLLAALYQSPQETPTVIRIVGQCPTCPGPGGP